MHIIKKLWARGVLKCQNFLGANGAQSLLGRPKSPSTAAPHSAFNGNSRTFATNPSCNGCTNASCILSNHGHEEFKNVNPFSVQKAHKAVRAGQYVRPRQRRIVPSMEIRVNSLHFLVRYKSCTKQGAYYQEAMGKRGLKMSEHSRYKRPTKPFRPAKISGHCSAA